MLPALLIAFNRPAHTARVLESLQLNGVQQLYVAIDGPRNASDSIHRESILALLQEVEWADDVHTRIAERNQGPGWGPRNAISWFFDQVSAGIIVEDDTVLAPQAARFMSDTSQHFTETTRMTAATSLGAESYRGHASYFASRYATTWGWATTQEAWSIYDYTMERWPELRATSWLREVGGSREFAAYWTNIFDMTYADRDHFWDYQWQYSMWLQGWNCWHPAANLVTNVGAGEMATHTTEHLERLTGLPQGDLAWPLQPPKDDRPDTTVDRWIDRNVYRTRRSLRGRLYRALRG